MTPRAAAERFRSQLNVSRCRKRTCSTSKVWRLNEEKEDSHWRLLPGNWNSNAAIRDASEIHDDVECRIIEHPDADVPVRIVFRGWTSPKVFAETVDMLANRGRQDWEDDDGDDVRARLGRLSAEQWRRVLGRTLRPMSALPDMGNGGISGNADTAYGCGPPD